MSLFSTYSKTQQTAATQASRRFCQMKSTGGRCRGLTPGPKKPPAISELGIVTTERRQDGMSAGASSSAMFCTLTESARVHQNTRNHFVVGCSLLAPTATSCISRTPNYARGQPCTPLFLDRFLYCGRKLSPYSASVPCQNPLHRSGSLGVVGLRCRGPGFCTDTAQR